MARLLGRLIAAQDGWARPLGDFNHRWLRALFRPIYPVKDFLNGTWFGHPVHAAMTDLPIGTLVLAVVLDIAGQNSAADIAIAATILFMLGAAVTGAADYTDTDGTARTRATTHATLMVVALIILVVSLGLRASGDTYRSLAVALGIIGLLVVLASAFIGGDVVYAFGNMVNRHAFRGAGTKWVRLDLGDLTDLAQLPELTPRKAKAGINDIVLVRTGGTVNALHAVCAHAGGPLAEGTVVDGCIECPWHASRFRLTDGALRQGPSVYEQPAYEIRAAETGGYEVRRQQ
ncbi:MAG: Rieske 2Fe-2S domain-containing protein [Chloroflexota bacterium]